MGEKTAYTYGQGGHGAETVTNARGYAAVNHIDGLITSIVNNHFILTDARSSGIDPLGSR